MGGFDTSGPLPGVKNHITDFRLTLDGQAEQWWSALLTLDATAPGISIDKFVDGLATGISNNLIVPVVYTAADRAALYSRNFVSVIARKSALDALNAAGSNPQVTNIELGIHIAQEHIDFNAVPQDVPAVKTQVPADTVVMAVIDDGIAIGHDLFRDAPTSTRIWHADLLAVPPNPMVHNATYGRTFDKAGIDALLAANTVDGLLDEAAFYADTGQVDFGNTAYDPISQRQSHGTHVTALAAGYPMGENPSNRPIVCVALPPAVTADVTGQSLLPSLALALQSITNVVQQYQLDGLPDLVPVVMNFSYGNTSGPHDGTDETSALLEWYAHLNADQKVWMTLPSGNENLSQGHAVLPLDQPSAVTMVALPDDRTASHVELWMPFGLDMDDMSRIKITVTTPTGEAISFAPQGSGVGVDLLDGLGEVIGRISYTYKPAPTERGMFTLSLTPTFSLAGSAGMAPSGRWGISAEVLPGACAIQGDLTLWVRRDESQPGYNSGGRQSYFTSGAYKRFGDYGLPVVVDPVPDPSPIRRAGTINGFGCGQSPLVVASFTASTAAASGYSASGAMTVTPNSPARVGPDAATKGDDSRVMGGVISAGTSSGSFVRMNGTSVAAPRMARFVADHIKDATVPAREFVFDYLGAPAQTDLRIGAGLLTGIPMPWYATS